MLHPSDITLTDMFCGAGGSSAGAINVQGVEIRQAMNHWKLAVDSHNANFPNANHDVADVSNTHPARYNRTTGLIASPECTNHSLAKSNGKRKNLAQQDIFQAKAFDPSAVRSRATMWDVPRFAEIHRYDFVIVENVFEVRNWVMYNAWLSAMYALGYKHECVYLNAMFAHDCTGRSFAPQSRDRIYIVFWKKGNNKPDLNIRPKAPCSKCGNVEAYQAWKPGRRAGKYKAQYIYRCSVCNDQVVPYYYAAINAIDFSIPMVRIGDREANGLRPLTQSTLKRAQYGLDKFGNSLTIIDQRNQHGTLQSRIRVAESEPLNAQTTGYSSYLFAPYLLNIAQSNSQTDRTYGPADAFPTQTTKGSMALVAPQPYIVANRNNSVSRSLTEPIHTQTTALQEILIAPPGSYLFNQSRMDKGQAFTDPLKTITTLKDMVGFVVPIHGTARPRHLTDSMDTIMTSGHTALVTSEVPKIEDCYFRMLQPEETKLAQGFPTDYVILGNKTQRQKQIGNANPPPTMELLVGRCVDSLL